MCSYTRSSEAGNKELCHTERPVQGSGSSQPSSVYCSNQTIPTGNKGVGHLVFNSMDPAAKTAENLMTVGSQIDKSAYRGFTTPPAPEICNIEAMSPKKSFANVSNSILNQANGQILCRQSDSTRLEGPQCQYNRINSSQISLNQNIIDDYYYSYDPRIQPFGHPIDNTKIGMKTINECTNQSNNSRTRLISLSPTGEVLSPYDDYANIPMTQNLLGKVKDERKLNLIYGDNYTYQNVPYDIPGEKGGILAQDVRRYREPADYWSEIGYNFLGNPRIAPQEMPERAMNMSNGQFIWQNAPMSEFSTDDHRYFLKSERQSNAKNSYWKGDMIQHASKPFNEYSSRVPEFNRYFVEEYYIPNDGPIEENANFRFLPHSKNSNYIEENNMIRMPENNSSNCSSRHSASSSEIINSGESIWGEEIEQAFIEAIEKFPIEGRTRIKVGDRSQTYGRNDLIQNYIYSKTGKSRSKKQISSHIQVHKKRKMKISDKSGKS